MLKAALAAEQERWRSCRSLTPRRTAIHPTPFRAEPTLTHSAVQRTLVVMTEASAWLASRPSSAEADYGWRRPKLQRGLPAEALAKAGGGGGFRTPDPRLMSPLLYHLSYTAMP